ncbi:thiamine-phosphate kinase [Actinomadura sp. 6N118]|uniref:thiamine-phosphate kinase n=1 Tax=Actinomadura sp. 6N118 TaxID=3375151 RepID=UPI00378C780B
METIGALGEFGLIARLTRRLPQGPAVALGPGDDAAVVRAPDGRVVATTDLLVEGRHFRLDWSGPYDIGRKAASQNLADVVAMGARPTALLIGLALPADTSVEWAERLYDGLADECARTGASVAGGDVVGASEITIAVTALGDLGGEVPLTRSGAQPGEIVAVRGRIGYSSAGLDLLSAGLDGPAELMEAHRRPQPPYEAGQEARALGATALMDVSDGLLQDLGHIATASGVRIEVESAAVPVADVLGPDGRRAGGGRARPGRAPARTDGRRGPRLRRHVPRRDRPPARLERHRPRHGR